MKLCSGPGSHPELGDTVYSTDGEEELGTVQFFYQFQPPSSYAVKLDNQDVPDPLLVDHTGGCLLASPKAFSHPAGSTITPVVEDNNA